MSSNRLFGVDIAGIIHGAMSSTLLPATLISKVPGTRTTGTQAAGTNPTSTSYACRGFVDTYSAFQISSGMVQAQDRKVVLIGNSISGGAVVPKPGDQVTIEAKTYDVVAVRRDPAGAAYELQSR